MAGGLVFQGVLADNNVVNLVRWNIDLVIIFGLSFVIFVFNIIVIFKKYKSK